MEQLGVLLAALYAALTGLSIVLDRVVMTDFLDEPGSLLLSGKTTTAVISLGVAAIAAVNFTPSPRLAGFILLLALFKTVPVYAYFKVIEEADASTVSPILSMQPLITVGLAVLILGESLMPVEIASIVGIVIAVFMLTIAGLRDWVFNFGDLGGNFFFNRHAIAATGIAFVWSFEAIVIKYVLGFASFWTLFFWVNIVAGVLSLGFLARSQVRSEIKSALSRSSNLGLAVVSGSEFISGISMLAMFAAYEYARVSIVAPVLQSYSAFVFLFVIFLHLRGVSVDEKTSGEHIKRKALATIIIFTGIALLALL